MDNPQPKKRGRPRKELVEAAKKRPPGRPKGDNSAIEEFKARLIASPKSRKVFDSIMDAALNDEHKNQAAAWKLLMDRLLPLSYFEKDKVSGSRPSVNITISVIGGTVDIGGMSDSTDEPDYIDVEDKNDVG